MKILYRKNRRRQRGQAFVEYVILVAVIALAALFVLANFSDRLRDMVNGITVSLGGEKSSNDKGALQTVQELSDSGIEAE